MLSINKREIVLRPPCEKMIFFFYHSYQSKTFNFSYYPTRLAPWKLGVRVVLIIPKLQPLASLLAPGPWYPPTIIPRPPTSDLWPPTSVPKPNLLQACILSPFPCPCPRASSVMIFRLIYTFSTRNALHLSVLLVKPEFEKKKIEPHWYDLIRSFSVEPN